MELGEAHTVPSMAYKFNLDSEKQKRIRDPTKKASEEEGHTCRGNSNCWSEWVLPVR